MARGLPEVLPGDDPAGQPRARLPQQCRRSHPPPRSRQAHPYPGGYDAFERQRAERQAQLASAKAKQQAEREKLQDYIARNSARASTAKQAQSRAKALARMQPIAELVDDPSLSFDFPDPDALRPPLITLDMADVGYTETPILKRLNLRLDPDDRIALLGRNGNGKTTLARLLAAQLDADGGQGQRVGQAARRLFHPISGGGARS
jgi:ATPase subunit of ABC transporter with duplicated ATPase domains